MNLILPDDLQNGSTLLFYVNLGLLALLALPQLRLDPRGPGAYRLRQWQGHLTLSATLLSAILLALSSSEALSWLAATLVLGLSAIVIRFSHRFLDGDQEQGRAMAWMGLLSISASLTWLCQHLLLLLAAWGCALYALTRLIGLYRDWPQAQHALRQAGMMLGLAWLGLALVVALQAIFGTSLELQHLSSADWPQWAQGAAALGLLLAVLIPAAQWPLQRWLMSSMASPTPVSALMHAGMVNAGGLLLCKMGQILGVVPVFQAALLVVATLSIIIGSGMSLVQVDVKRQLAASTVAQMGCMLAQCALGAYGAALIHLLLHGAYKARLFLYAGSALAQQRALPPARSAASTWSVLPALLLFSGLVAASAILSFSAQGVAWGWDGSDLFSVLLLSATVISALHTLISSNAMGSATLSWRNLGWGLACILLLLAVHAGLQTLSADQIPARAHTPGLPPLLTHALALILIAASCALLAIRQRPQLAQHAWAQRAYWFLLRAGEASAPAQSSQARHLQQTYLRQFALPRI